MTLKGPSALEHTFEMDSGAGFKLLATDICTK
jgi:hypothetical protein